MECDIRLQIITHTLMMSLGDCLRPIDPLMPCVGYEYGVPILLSSKRYVVDSTVCPGWRFNHRFCLSDRHDSDAICLLLDAATVIIHRVPTEGDTKSWR